MKKVTLSAAILALSMMGCSDVGLDNSVASAPASEVKSEQTHNFLAKSIYYNQANIFYRLENMAPTTHANGTYHFYAYPDAGIGLKGITQDDLDWDGWEAIGEYHVVQAPFAPNTMLVATGLFSDCKLIGNTDNVNCRGFHNVGVEYRVNEGIMDLVAHSPRSGGKKLSKDKWFMELGAVSAFVGVWNQQSPYEFVTNGATYKGGMFEEVGGAKLARALYKKYIWPEIRDRLFFD